MQVEEAMIQMGLGHVGSRNGFRYPQAEQFPHVSPISSCWPCGVIASYDLCQVAVLFLEHPDVDVDKADLQGNTPLLIAIKVPWAKLPKSSRIKHW